MIYDIINQHAYDITFYNMYMYMYCMCIYIYDSI